VEKLSLYTDKNFNSLRNRGDELTDEAVKAMIKSPDLCIAINSWKNLPEENELMQFPEAVQIFFQTFSQKPDFINPNKVKIAQEFFDKESNLYLALLGFYSLPYCYAFADGAQVLIRSKRIIEDIGRRLSETALFLLDSYRPGTFLDHDQALLTIAKVRLIHAFSRYFVSHYAKDWQPEWGDPINQEDLMGTNLAFSLMVMRGMEKLDKFPGTEVHEAVLHYWKIIGHYLGLDTTYWPETAKEAYELEKLIRKRNLKASEAGEVLTCSLLGFFEKNIPNQNLTAFSETMVAYFLGNEAARAVGISQKVKLPKGLYGLILDLSFVQQGGLKSNYQKTRQQFLAQSKSRFGEELALNIPVIPRS
jgi:hypothetical protein